MGTGFASYEIARSGMFVNERGLYVTGHNISNANTAGYVRQQAMITSAQVMNENGKYQVGLGADIQEIRQIRHSFLDNTFRNESTTEGYWESKNKTLQDVQSILNEPMGSGLQDVINQFWDSWQELSKAPESLTVRALVRQRSEALVQQVNHTGDQIKKLQGDLNSEIGVRIDEVNQITGKIANLNIEILKNEVTGDTANDYRDQRNLLVDRLSKLVNADVSEMQDGQLAVTLGGYFLVTKNIQKNLYAGESKAGGLFYVPKLEGTDIEVPIRNGIIKGLMESRGEVFGATGSLENGTPNTKADVTFAVDVSNTSAGYLGNVKNNIANYVNGLKNSGIDYDLHLITYGNNVLSNDNFGKDTASMLNAIPTVPVPDAGNNFGGPGGLLEGLESINDFRQNANKFAVVFTGESIDGDGGAAITDAASYINRLNSKGIKMSVVTDKANFGAGNPAGELGWDSITNATDGKLYDINTPSADYATMMSSIASDTNTSVNKNISTIPESTNIIPDLLKKLNANINIVLREVNKLHKSGSTLNGQPGQDIFTAIDNSLPLEVGNIQLNQNLLDLNNVVASASGESGDNNIALKIANLRGVPLMSTTKTTLNSDDYYQSIILDVGNAGADAQRICENQQKLVQSADDYRTSITGVSMDEEMTNMMKYQFAYSASARLINVIDQMTETVVTKMGISGR